MRQASQETREIREIRETRETPEPDGRLLYVPVRSTNCGAITLRTGRLDSGERIGLAFTSEAALVATLGAGQAWINLAGGLVAGMFAEAGAVETRIDALPVVVSAAASVASAPVSAAALAPVSATASAVAEAEPVRGPEPRPILRVRALRRPVRHHARPTAVRHAF